MDKTQTGGICGRGLLRLITWMYVGLCFVPDTAFSCTVIHWTHMSMEQVLYQADIVVYGQETSRYTSGTVNAIFEVFCVLKDSNYLMNMTTNIVIEEVEPRTSCSATEIETMTHIILALQRIASGNYIWHEVNILDTAAYDATTDNLNKVMTICGLQQVALPSDYNVTSSNPVCPVSSGSACDAHGGAQTTKWNYSLMVLSAVLSWCFNVLYNCKHNVI